MAEPLTSQLVGEQLQRLHAAFPRNLGSQNPAMMIEVYRNGLRGLSGDAVRVAVDRAIQEETYFPKVAKLREIATAWQRVNEAKAEPRFDVDPLWCPNCRTRAAWRERYRPLVTKDRRVCLSHDRQWLLLERYERLLCDCATPSLYRPDPDADPLAMRVKDVMGIPQGHALAVRDAMCTTDVCVSSRASVAAAD